MNRLGKERMGIRGGELTQSHKGTKVEKIEQVGEKREWELTEGN